ncbi:microcin C transport system substrate-binding protein [Pseudochelatococcus contaminans]|uniref:Microcin C transport system substrate-binding protein n=1 Tax=Pseudochelatococcus contaminans TaxID=1538103 RepID=A0A7W6EEK7_9HYPH|nr:extracellular solute-binding protein [Pseudochelatococcus contaminans]MBB3808279.1 microcin C transport system substrate-binding protein [Pseudochelatococcus contaminans]
MVRRSRTPSPPSVSPEVLRRSSLLATRRDLFGLAGGLIGVTLAAHLLPGVALAQEEPPPPGEAFESHGLSAFDDLQLPKNFPHFPYVNPDAPKGGKVTMRVTQGSFDTFNTLNAYVLQGDAAAGMSMTFDSLMAGSGDEPDALYGLVAESVSVSPDRRTYSFRLRPEARFHDGTPITADDVVFSFNILKEKGHPSYRALLAEAEKAVAEGDDVVTFTLSESRGRDLHLLIASLPIFSKAWWDGRDFAASTLDAPLGSGAYKVGRFEVGRFIEFDRVGDYWARDLNVNVGQNNFDKIRYEYFRDEQVMFEAFKSGLINFHEEYTASLWANGYDFAAFRDGRVKREKIETAAAPNIQGWYFNTRRDKFADPRVREAIGLAFDFEWTNAKIMHDAYERTTSFFEHTPLKAEGLPSPEELALLEPFRGQVPDEVFGEPFVPPVSDGSGNDRNQLRRAFQLLTEAGYKREGNVLRGPDGKPFEIEFLDASARLQPHIQPFQAALGRLGIKATSRIVDPSQYQERLKNYDFDVVSVARRGSLTPGPELRVFYGSEAGRTPGGMNLAGITNPAVDALIERVANTRTREEITVAAKALDRVLRAGRYWVPMWFRADEWYAFWDVFSRPDTSPRYSSGAPGTWWFDADKAKRIGWRG